MIAWIVAASAGVALAVLVYRWREPGALATLLPFVALRALALTLVSALLLDAPAGRRRPAPPLVALDVSESWTRAGDGAAWRDALARARALATDSLILMGDSVRAGSAPQRPSDLSSRLQPLAERALGAGRPLVLITDGEVDDPASARNLPAGSRVDVRAAGSALDAAVVSIEAPRAVVSGDTVELRVTVRAGGAPAPAGSLVIALNGRELSTVPLGELAARAERTESVRVPVAGPPGAAVLEAAARVANDAEPRNNSVALPIDVARAAGAVLVSSSPDYDSRFLLPVLRGAVALPTRGYYRVSPAQWRQDGTLTPVSEPDVRRALREAPLAILHGDTAVFGAPRTAASGSLALFAPPAPSGDEWYAAAAPPSPIAAALSGIAWDSLPPIDVASSVGMNGWQGLVVARGRQYERRPAIVGSESGRRIVVVGASGLWRWSFRGGTSADAYAALWGSIFDWLSAERMDARGAIPAEGLVRAGERIRWRRGGAPTGGDSVVTAVLTRRGAPAEEDSVTLRFGAGGTVAESDPLPAGLYDVRVPGGSAVLAVNASHELLPRAPTLSSGNVGGAATVGDRPRLRDRWWPYVVVVLALCAEWLLRRRRGLR
jgi:hypothetical protein